MLPKFSLINMNARLYDPVLGRMLKPDNFLQQPYNAQNYNRYSYCMNNPLKYPDPSGNFFLESWVAGFVSGFFSTGSNRFGTAWHEANGRTSNTGKMFAGLVKSDPDKTFGGKVWEVVSRFSWQSMQTTLGFLYNQGANTAGFVDDVQYFHGATFSVGDSYNGNSFTPGSYIAFERPEQDSENEGSITLGEGGYTAMHEYGHYLQSQTSGPLFLLKYGIPSLMGGLTSPKISFTRGSDWTEMDANTRIARCFNSQEGFNWLQAPCRYRTLAGNKRDPRWFEYPLFFSGNFFPIIAENWVNFW